MSFSTPEEEYKLKEKFKHHFEGLFSACEELGWGDPFSYARSKEMAAVIELGHELSNKYSGADAINKDGDEVEYKSTTGKTVQGAYTGISVQPTWEEQEKYLREEKIAKYPEHYYNRFDGGKLVESWVLDGSKVLEVLLPKLRKKYPTVLNKKDPRLSATVTTREIKKYGRRVI